MYPSGTSFEDRITTVATVSDNPEAFSLLEPRMSLFDKVQSQFRFCLVAKTPGLNLGLGWPPEPGSIRETKHPVTDSRKTNRKTYDDKAHTITLLFRLLRGRTIMLPTRSADRLTAVLVQGVVNNHQDFTPNRVERLYQHPEKVIRYKVTAPSTSAQKSVNAGKMPRFMELHGQNHLAHGVLSHRKHPTYHKGYEDAVTWSTEASHESYVVNAERM